MPFFDFHLHPTLKSMFSQINFKADPWQKIDTRAINWVLRWCTDFDRILNSQANLSQLLGVGCNLVCVPLFAPERGMTADKFLLKQAEGTMYVYLDPERLKFINRDDTSPFALVVEDIEQVLLNPAKFNVNDKQIVPLSKQAAYDADDPSKLYVAFTVEGAHSLADSFDKEKITTAEVVKNLDAVRAKGWPVISLNLTHLEQYHFCNHAYGILFVSSENFKPTQNAIRAEGVELITECYRHGIMIDIKHMSLGARRMLIEQLRVHPNIQPFNQPIICTHAGFTGLSYEDIPDYLEFQRQGKKKYSYLLWGKPRRYGDSVHTAFNPSSINLYDEDILAILQSGGMIGLSLDKRILGVTSYQTMPEELNGLAFEEEYISNEEKRFFLTKRTTGKRLNDNYCITVAEVNQGGEVNPAAALYHLRHFMSHILHLVKVAGAAGYDVNRALTQVCIGSDFDGIINPIWCCPGVESLPAFKEQFIDRFPTYAHDNREEVSLPPGFDVQRFADQLFFENGRNFLLQRLGR